MTETNDERDSRDFAAACRAHIAGDLAMAELYYRQCLSRRPDHDLTRYFLSGVLYERGGACMDEALNLIRLAADSAPHNAAIQFTRGNICTALELWHEAVDSYRCVIEAHPDMPDAYLRIKAPMLRSGRPDELVDLFDRAVRAYPRMALERTADFTERQAEARRRGIPPLLFVTMPKSASVYVLLRFAHGLGIPTCRVSLDLFPADQVIPSWAEGLAEGGAVCQEHVDASPANLARLRAAGLSRLVVHVRDPRQATLSWTHHLESMTGDRAYLGDLVSPPLPDDYRSWHFARKLDWNIEHHLPALLSWTEGWLRASEDRREAVTVMFTRYEDFRVDEDAYCRRILEFHGLDASSFRSDPVPIAKERLHFRKGETDEWRAAFSPEQQQRAASLMPESLCRAFGWAR